VAPTLPLQDRRADERGHRTKGPPTGPGRLPEKAAWSIRGGQAANPINRNLDRTPLDHVVDDVSQDPLRDVRSAMMVRRTQGDEAGQAWLDQLAAICPQMARIRVSPSWVGLLDFETRFPSALERAMERAQA